MYNCSVCKRVAVKAGKPPLMKTTIKNILAVALLFAGIALSGCIKDDDQMALSAAMPLTGDFEGPFKVLKKKPAGSGYDTIINDTLHLRLKADSGFTITGDTTNHAASNGAFINQNFIQFNDRTYNTKPQKKHLHGLYNYFYDGQKLQITRSYADTLGIIYDLKKK